MRTNTLKEEMDQKLAAIKERIKERLIAENNDFVRAQTNTGQLRFKDSCTSQDQYEEQKMLEAMSTFEDLYKSKYSRKREQFEQAKRTYIPIIKDKRLENEEKLMHAQLLFESQRRSLDKEL